MNEKALVSKELNDKHTKVLLGLLKLPENKECADCRSKAPRWASINLGIFICMRCSGIHRSLGVHISKVRSTTLDTWLPEQVAFMQMMGNQKSNSYFEADLPATFERNQMEQFIYAKYVNKRWASTTSPQPQAEIRIEDQKCGRKEIPKKARKYSLDENFFNKEIFAHSTRYSSAKSFNKIDGFLRGPHAIACEGSSTLQNVDAAAAGKDLFRLFYVSEEAHDRTVVPPSRWATFE